MIPASSLTGSGAADEGPTTHSDVAGPGAVAEPDPDLANAVDVAYRSAAEEAGAEQVGEHLGVAAEPDAVTHFFSASLTGYRGWRWAVTVANAGGTGPITVSEVVLLPGPDALTGPQWLPWSQRVRAGDLGAGDIMPTRLDDPRLARGYADSDDPAVVELAREVGLGRERVLSDHGRCEAASRWRGGEFGPRSDMARAAPGPCVTCGFYLPVAGAMRGAFGVCGNEISPADGHVVHAEYGCGAHSESEVDTSPAVPVTEVVYDDSGLEVVSDNGGREVVSDNGGREVVSDNGGSDGMRRE